MDSDSVELKLTKDEALLLFEWLAHLDAEGGGLDPTSAEQRVLWHLQAQLEQTLVEPFAPNYQTLLTEARRRVLAAG